MRRRVVAASLIDRGDSAGNMYELELNCGHTAIRSGRAQKEGLSKKKIPPKSTVCLVCKENKRLILMTKTEAAKNGLKLKKDATPKEKRMNGYRQEYFLYSKEDFEPKRQCSEAQLRALAAGRELIGTKSCVQCSERAQSYQIHQGLCWDCFKQEQISLAKEWFESPFCILDTETTGLDETAQIIEIAVIDERGRPLLNTLVKPSLSIPAESTAIHGLVDSDVANAPLFDDVYPQLLAATEGRKIIIYNSSYDNRLIKQSLKDEANLQSFTQLVKQSNHCLMKLFARFYGEEDDYGRFRWKSLSHAASYFDVPVNGAHRALADCRMTLGVLKNMAAL